MTDNEAIREYGGYARSIAWHYLKKSRMPLEEIDDLEQEAKIGLVIANQKYDPDKSSFRTYAGFWIKQRVLFYIRQRTTIIREPNYLVEQRHIGKAKKPKLYMIEDNIEDLKRDDYIPFIERLPDIKDLEADLIKNDLELRAVDELKKLPKRPRTMAQLYYLDGYMLEEIGQLYGLTRERIRQIIQKEVLPELRKAIGS